MRRLTFAGILAALLVAGCAAGPRLGSAGSSASGPADPLPAPIPAARAFLELPGARFEMKVERWKPDQPLEIEWTATGTVDPRADSGSMVWAVYSWVPGSSDHDDVEIRWNRTDYWSSSPTIENEWWLHVDRKRAPEMALISRVQEEPLALVRFVAEANPATIEALPPGSLDGGTADRWLIQVPLERSSAAYVPPDTYASLHSVFGVDALPLEAWLRDGRLVRLRYVFARDKAPYGGPDRIETTYDWTPLSEAPDLGIPPPGPFREPE